MSGGAGIRVTQFFVSGGAKIQSAKLAFGTHLNYLLNYRIDDPS